MLLESKTNWSLDFTSRNEKPTVMVLLCLSRFLFGCSVVPGLDWTGLDMYQMWCTSLECLTSNIVSDADESHHSLFPQVSGARYHPSVQSERQQKQFQVSDSVDASGRSSAHIGRSRIWNRILDSCFDNSDRRQYGRGLMGRAFGRSFKENVRKEKDVSKAFFLLLHCL